MDWGQILSLDVPPVLTAIFSAVSCALLGNYLVLRKLSLMGDAISHSVLPGIVIAFLLTSSRASWPIFIGAAVAGVLSAVLIELVRKLGRVDTGASMGVVFSIFFALGVLLIEQAAARSIDLDADCLLHGQLESVFWYPPSVLTLSSLALLPSEVFSSFFSMLAVIGFVTLFYKELRIASFDPALATTLGFNASILHHLLMVFVACAVVASFKVVGSILVIAMIICPAAAARMYTDKLSRQLALSVLIAVLCTLLGYFAGAFGPQLLGFEHSLSSAGSISVMLGLCLTLSIVFAPTYGVLAKSFRLRRLSLEVRCEDILGFIFRNLESGDEKKNLREGTLNFFSNYSLSLLALRKLIAEQDVIVDREELKLTSSGKKKAKRLVKAHRLWETYLVDEVGLESDHVHETAEYLEHLDKTELQERMFSGKEQPQLDPHGKKIPD